METILIQPKDQEEAKEAQKGRVQQVSSTIKGLT